jgi:hypothetical protein
MGRFVPGWRDPRESAGPVLSIEPGLLFSGFLGVLAVWNDSDRKSTKSIKLRNRRTLGKPKNDGRLQAWHQQ